MAAMSQSNAQVASNRHKSNGAFHGAHSRLKCTWNAVRTAIGLMSA